MWAKSPPHELILANKNAILDKAVYAPSTRRPLCNRNPIVACGGDKGLMHEAMVAIHAFRRAYRAAWNEFKVLGRATFPAGSFKMRTRFHMPCAEGCFGWCLLSAAWTHPEIRPTCPLN